MLQEKLFLCHYQNIEANIIQLRGNLLSLRDHLLFKDIYEAKLNSFSRFYEMWKLI